MPMPITFFLRCNCLGWKLINSILKSSNFSVKNGSQEQVSNVLIQTVCVWDPFDLIPIHQDPYSLPYECHQVQYCPASLPHLFSISACIWKYKFAGWSLARASNWVIYHIMPSVIVLLKSYTPAVLLLSLPLPNFSAVCILPQGQV